MAVPSCMWISDKFVLYIIIFHFNVMVCFVKLTHLLLQNTSKYKLIVNNGSSQLFLNDTHVKIGYYKHVVKIHTQIYER